MIITLNLQPELEERLTLAARSQALSPDLYALKVLDQHVPSELRRAQLVALLQSWIDRAEPSKQSETGDDLMQMIDEDRLSDRKLYPPELQGVTW